MVKVKKGCVINAAKSGEIDVLMVGCNCFSTWGSGINKSLLNHGFTGAFLADRNDSRLPHQKIGGYFVYKVETAGPIVVGLYTQYDYGTSYRRFEYGSFKSALEKFRDSIGFLSSARQDLKIGLPRIGSGLGGGNPKIIQDILEEILGCYDVTIYELED